MRLYFHPFSPNSRRANMTAYHLDAPVERIEVDLRKGEHKRPEYLRLNPNGKVPTLDDDGFLLWESRAIMMYLADKTPGQTIYPHELRARADVNRWLSWDAVHFMPAVATIAAERFVKGLLGLGPPDPKEIERGERLLAPLLPVLDSHLATRTWISGDALTIADLSIATPLALASRIQVVLPANVAAWHERVAALDAWKRTAPQLPT
jgi:glutathione S-transferase